MANTEDVNKALNGAVEQARTPVMAAIGAGDLAAHTVADTVKKIRTELNKRAESARADLPNDFGELRERFDPTELRKRVDSYTQSAVQFYGYLAERGAETLDRLQSQPQVKAAWSQVATAQEKVEETVGDVRELADDVLGKVSRGSRSAGEKAAATTEHVTKKTADATKEAGEKAASTTRSTARKTAAKTSPAKTSTSSTTKRTSSQSKSS